MGKPSKVTIAKARFAAWAVKAAEKGLLMLDAQSPTCTLTVQGSGMMFVGYTNDDPFVFVGVHTSMMPWFLDMPWIRADIIPSCNRIHMIAQMNEETQLTLIIHEDKGLCQWLSKVDPNMFKLPFRTVMTLDNREMAWSKAVNKRLPFRILENLTRKSNVQEWAKPLIKG